MRGFAFAVGVALAASSTGGTMQEPPSRIERIAGPPGLPFSALVKADGLLYVAGTMATDTVERPVEGDIRVQTRRTLESIGALLRRHGSGLDRVLSVNVYLTRAEDFAAMNEVYTTFFPKDPPARTTVVAAWVVPGVLVGVLWRILLVENRSGILNYLLSLVGVGTLPFLSSPGIALACTIVANVWWGSAFSMILLYAGLLRIPQELHEAADLEGLFGIGRLRLLTLPQIAPVLGLNLALITIATLNTFDLILPLTGGGPARATEVVALYMYRSAFFNLEAGRAAAVALVMLAVNLSLALFALRLWRRGEEAGEP